MVVFAKSNNSRQYEDRSKVFYKWTLFMILVHFSYLFYSILQFLRLHKVMLVNDYTECLREDDSLTS